MVVMMIIVLLVASCMVALSNFVTHYVFKHRWTLLTTNTQWFHYLTVRYLKRYFLFINLCRLFVLTESWKSIRPSYRSIYSRVFSLWKYKDSYLSPYFVLNFASSAFQLSLITHICTLVTTRECMATCFQNWEFITFEQFLAKYIWNHSLFLYFQTREILYSQEFYVHKWYKFH